MKCISCPDLWIVVDALKSQMRRIAMESANFLDRRQILVQSCGTLSRFEVRMRNVTLPLIAFLTIAAPIATAGERETPLKDPRFFPIAVWLQDPTRAAQYKEIGINVYVGLWKGPTEKQLAELKKHNLRVVCAQNAVGLAHKDDPTILAWMHGDEPDNAQSLGKGKGYGAPILPAKIIEDYGRIKKADPTRPVLLNLGQGVAWDQYIGRGERRNHPEDYVEYVKGSDIASFDIYPACHEHKDIAGKLWYVGDGVSRLRKWAGDKRSVWNCIECTHISNPKTKATPAQVKAEVWMSLVRGSRGIIYFVHQFQPKFIEAGVFADAEMTAEIKAINRQIHELAPVLNSAEAPKGLHVESSVKDVPIEATLRRHDGASYVFAVGMRPGKTTARFRVVGMTGNASVRVLGENRTLAVKDGAFEDSFAPWDVHLYEIRSE
jgi:hypothetical protein